MNVNRKRIAILDRLRSIPSKSQEAFAIGGVIVSFCSLITLFIGICKVNVPIILIGFIFLLLGILITIMGAQIIDRLSEVSGTGIKFYPKESETRAETTDYSEIEMDKQHETIAEEAREPESTARTRLCDEAFEAQKLQNWEEAVGYWRTLVGLYPEDPYIHFFLGFSLHEMARKKTKREREKALYEALDNFRKTLSIEQNIPEVINNIGNVYVDLARFDSKKADQLLAKAYEKYNEALKINPELYLALSNWGMALKLQATIESGKKADRLYSEAYKKFQQALKINPDMDKPYKGWGDGLYEQAKTKQGVEADKLFEDSYEKFEKALINNPKSYQTLVSWGEALAHQAKTKNKEEAEHLFHEAHSKFKKSIEINPNLFVTYVIWSTTLLLHSRIEIDEERKGLLEEAYDKCMKAENIMEGTASYNVACVFSLRGEKDKCANWLYKAKDAGFLPPCKHMNEDADLDPLRNLEWFKTFLRDVKKSGSNLDY